MFVIPPPPHIVWGHRSATWPQSIQSSHKTYGVVFHDWAFLKATTTASSCKSPLGLTTMQSFASVSGNAQDNPG
ncbi:hypothetical protein EDB84DRAFT_1566496 [Lactarius hengduanensis]|nr:hypothetical protein EDB84DRAFT_1566496 [Lactarius hengduanensis]